MKCPEEEERGQEASVDDPGFSSEGPGQSKLAGSGRSCHSFPPATEPSAASAPRHEAACHQLRGKRRHPQPSGTRAPRQTQELGGGRGPAQTRVRPLSFPTKKRQECSAKSPAHRQEAIRFSTNTTQRGGHRSGCLRKRKEERGTYSFDVASFSQLLKCS